MKKIFTLICAAMAAMMAANAEESIMGASTWSPWNAAATAYVNGHFTFAEAWSGAGYWMGIDEDDDGITDFWADWSDYDYLVYVVADVKGSYNLCVEYYDDDNPSNNHATMGTIGTNGYGYVALDSEWRDYVAQTWIQPTSGGSSLTITDMLLMTKDEFEEFKEKLKPTGDIVNLWKGEIDFNNSWPSISINADAFSIAEENDKLIITISEITEVDGWDWGTQIFCNNGAWRGLPNMSLAGITTPGEYTFVLAQEQLDSIADTGGVKIQGMACKVTSVDLMKADAVFGTVIWEGSVSFDNSWPNISGMGPEIFSDAKAGDKIVVTVASIDNIDEWPWGGQLMWRDGNYDDLAGTTTTSVNAPGEVTLMLAQETVDALKASGLVLQGMACTVTKIALVGSITHVDTVLVTSADDVIYNLCGQRVDASYKGLVIRNGKKYFNQ